MRAQSQRISRSPYYFVFFALSLLAPSLILPQKAAANDVFWNVQAGDWSSSANWDVGVSPTIYKDVFIANEGTATITASGSANSLYLGYAGTSGNVEMTGGDLTIRNAVYIGYSGTGTFNQTGGTLTTSSFAIQNTGTYNFSGGTLVTGSVAEMGYFNFGGGTLQLTKSITSSFSCTLTGINGNGVIDTNGNSVTNYGVFLGAGGLTKAGSGTLTLGGSNSYTGDTVLKEGTLAANNSYALQSSTVEASGGNLRASVIGGLKGTGALDIGTLNMTVGYNNQSTEYAGVLSGSGTITKAGSGMLTLSGSNAFSGTISVQTGTLRLNNENALQNAGLMLISGDRLSFGNLTAATIGGPVGIGPRSNTPITLTNENGEGVTLTIGANNPSSISYGSFIGLGGLTKIGSGVLTLNGSNSYTGDTVLKEGTLVGTYWGSLLSTTVDMKGGTLVATQIGGLKGTGALDIYNLLSIGANNQSTEYAGVLSGSGTITKVGSGTLTLSGSNAFSGYVEVSEGTLRLNNENALRNATLQTWGSGSFSFGSLTSASIGQLDVYRNNTPIVLTNENGKGVNLSIGANGNSTSVSFSLSGLGGLTKVGTGILTLSGSNGYTGDTFLKEGTLVVSNANALQFSTLNPEGGSAQFCTYAVIGGLKGTGALNIDASVSIGNNNQSTEYSGILSGSGGINKIGTGTLTLSSSNAFSGYIGVTGGKLRINNENALCNAFIEIPSNDRLVFGTITSATIRGTFLTAVAPSTATLTNELGEAVNLVINADKATSYVCDSFAGLGGLTKKGTGTLTLQSQENSFTGNTVVKEGTLVVTGLLTSSLLDVQAGKAVLTIYEKNSPQMDVQTAAGAKLSITGGTHTLDAITGSGTTIVSGDATLTVACLVQDTLILGGSGESGDGASASTAAAISSGATEAVPEPTTLILLAAAGVLALAARRRYAKAT